MSKLNKLNVKTVAAWQGPGMLSDGGNLYLSCASKGRKSWLFVYRSPITAKQRYLGLGSAGQDAVTLGEARAKAADARAQLRSGQDPLEERNKQEALLQQQKAPKKTVPTFGEFADAYIQDHKSAWKNPKHAAQWQVTLETHASTLRLKPVSDITTEDVLGVLEPIWKTIPETAHRLRGRIEKVLNAARAKKFSSVGGDVARWTGHLEHALPKRQKLTRGHHRALPFEQVPRFLRELQKRRELSPFLIEFCILTAARSGEVRGARWSEIDLNARLWIIPGSRMKAGKEHRVPLSDRAIEILKQMQLLRIGDCPYVFASRKNKVVSDATMTMLLKRMGYGSSATVHGFRSSFRDWASETTDFSNELLEMALAHTIANKAEAAYRRGDMLEKRRGLMNMWAMHCGGLSMETAASAVNALFHGLSKVSYCPSTSVETPFGFVNVAS